MLQGDKDVWVAWFDQKSEFIRGKREFPPAPEIPDETVDQRFRDWEAEHKNRCVSHSQRDDAA